MSEHETHLLSLQYPLEEIERKSRAIYYGTLRDSRYIRAANFTAVSADDVERLCIQYDEAFLDGLLAELLSREGEAPLRYRVSKTMTSAGGKTIMYSRRPGPDGRPGLVISYEIAISAPLLFQTFAADTRPIVTSGLTCADRLEALQRIVEHELIHLLELLVWRHTSCNQERFLQLANNLFAHTDVRHQLVTQREIAAQNYGIRLGDRVSFEFEGTVRTGIVNRVTKRATVLVESKAGLLHSDGKRYQKFYVPLQQLRPVVR